MHAPVLVLDASYEPINICAARRAIVLVLKGVAATEEINGHFLHSSRVSMRVPSVIRLLEYRRIPHQTRRSRAKTFCCATVTPASTASRVPAVEPTLDHVLPRSRGGLSPGKTWWPAVINAIAKKATPCPTSGHASHEGAAPLLAAHQPAPHAR